MIYLKEYADYTWCPQTFEPPFPTHLWDLFPTWDNSPIIAQTIPPLPPGNADL